MGEWENKFLLCSMGEWENNLKEFSGVLEGITYKEFM